MNKKLYFLVTVIIIVVAAILLSYFDNGVTSPVNNLTHSSSENSLADKNSSRSVEVEEPNSAEILSDSVSSAEVTAIQEDKDVPTNRGQTSDTGHSTELVAVAGILGASTTTGNVGLNCDPILGDILGDRITLSKNPQGLSEVSSASPITGKPLVTDLKSIDKLLETGSYEDVIRLLKVEIDRNGHTPDLTARLALAELSQGKNQLTADILNATEFGGFRNAASVVDEINERLSSETLSEADAAALHRVAEFADWTDHLGHNSQLSGKPKIDVENDQMVLAFQDDDLLRYSSEAELSEVFENGSAPVYTLNSLDWIVSIDDTTLADLPAGELPSVFQLARQDIAHFNPTTIYVGDQTVLRRARRPAVELKNTQPGRQLAHLYRPYQSSQDDENNDDNDFIYLVVEAPENLSVADIAR